jgi:hypothetical protein
MEQMGADIFTTRLAVRDLRAQRFGRKKRRAGVDDFTSSPFVKELEVKSQVFSPVGSALVLEIPGNSNV